MVASRVWAVAALWFMVACADKSTSSSPPSKPPPTKPSPEIKMTSTDPADPKAWEQAAAIAQQAVPGAKKLADTLPFLFAANGKAVLIHKGNVVEARGPAAAAAYLRDLGIIEFRGPKIDDILVALDVLDGLPVVDKLDRKAYLDKSVPDFGASLYSDGLTAYITLFYVLGGNPIRVVDPDAPPRKPGGEGSPMPVDPNQKPPRAAARMTLEITAKTEAAAWKRENLNIQ
jgi:hypothetical protein